MEVAALVDTNAAAAQAATGNGLGGISGEDFLNILLKQLQFQDPFEHMGNEEMAQQIATIRELEVNTRLGAKLEAITDQERVGSAAALIGKYAKGSVSDAEGNTFEAEGVVTGVRFNRDGEVILELDTGDALPLSGLTEVRLAGAEI